MFLVHGNMVKLLRIVITLVIIWFVFDQLKLSLNAFSDLSLQSLRPSIGLLAISSFLLFCGFVLSSLIWREIVIDTSTLQLTFVDSIAIYFSANICRYVPGKIWQIAGLAYLGKRSGIPKGLSVFSAVTGQLLSLTAAGVLSFSAFLNIEITSISGLVAIGGGGVIGFIITPAFLRWFASSMSAENFDTVSINWNQCTLKWFVLYLLNWVLYILSFWSFCHSIGFAYELTIVGPAFAGAYLLGYLSILTPAGLGVRELSMVLLLGTAMRPEEALLLALMSRLWITFVEIIPGVPLLIRELRLEKVNSL